MYCKFFTNFINFYEQTKLDRGKTYKVEFDSSDRAGIHHTTSLWAGDPLIEHYPIRIREVLVGVIVFMSLGLMLGINRRLVPLSLVFLGIYVGSLFSKGNGRIYPILIFFILTLFLSKKISNHFKKKKKGFFLRFFI